MSQKSSIITETQGLRATIWFNRPEKHNALDKPMIDKFLSVMQKLNSDPAIRVIIIQGKGPSFCAGADLSWMQQAPRLTAYDNFQECLVLARCFHAIATSPKVTVSLVHGAAFGGAAGFIAASDMAYASESCQFAFSEVRLGLIPATIAPYVIRKIGYSRAMELMLTGRKFSSPEAGHMGLINKSIPDDEFVGHTTVLIESILHGSPVSQQIIKASMNTWKDAFMNGTLVEQSARQLAETRITPEAMEGFSAFLEKRKAYWVPV